MGYAVLHSEKGKGGSGGIGNHIDREKGKEHSFRHADPERLNQNVVFKVHQDRQKISLPDAINERIEEGYKGKRAIRKDAVKFTTHILTGSHKEMKDIFKDKEKSEKWIQANYNFIAKEFGKENIVRFNLHLDEKTPHIHAVTVPLTERGKLSARELFGNKTDMRARQDRYAVDMKPFELERGMRRTGIKHEDAKTYYSRMELADNYRLDEERLTVNNTILGFKTSINKDKTIESYKEALKAQNVSLVAKTIELKRVKEHLEVAKKNANINAVKLTKVVTHESEYLKEQKKIIDHSRDSIFHEVNKAVVKELRLHKLTPEERRDIALDVALAEARRLKIGQDLYNKTMKKEFIIDLVKHVEKRATKNLEREQNLVRKPAKNLGKFKGPSL